ncbi:MAG: sugar-transfer associated ATP-grasp domain-containing protein [Oceanibaculum sp.]
MKRALSPGITQLFLGVTLLLAAYAILAMQVPASRWALDVLSGVVAAATAVVIAGRLALYLPSAAARYQWLFVLALMVLVSLGEFLEPGFDAPQFGSWVGYLLLATALVIVLLTGRFDPVPRAAQRAMWLGLLLQMGGVLAERLGDQPDTFFGLVDWSEIADLAPLLALQCYLAAAVLFIGYLRRQMFVVRRSPRDVGDVARYLFATSRFFHKQRYPRIGSFVVPGGSIGLGIARFFYWYPKLAAPVRARFGRGLVAQFIDLCAIGFRHGLDAQAYYMFQLYLPGPRSRASGFMTRYETKNGLFKVLNRQLPKYGKRTPLGDKHAMQQFCAAHQIPIVPTLIYATDGVLDIRDAGPDALARDLFVKPQQMKGARGTELIRYVDGGYVMETGARLTQSELLEHVASRSREVPLLVQPRLLPHPALAGMVAQSLPPLRVITCLDQRDEPVVTHGMVRVLCKLEPGWPLDLELGAPIDLTTGRIGEMTGDKPEMAFDWHAMHPVTGAPVSGVILPFWQEACALARAGHRHCPDRLMIGWDIAVTPEGALMLEGNSYADVDFPQRVHRCPIGDSPLGPLLFHRIADLEDRIARGTLRRGGQIK